MWKIFKPPNENCAAVYSISEEAESFPLPLSEAKSWFSHCFAHVFHACFSCVFLLIVLENFSFRVIGTQLSLIRPYSSLFRLNLSSHLFWKFQDLWLKQPTKWAVHIFACVSSVSLGSSESAFDSRYLFCIDHT